MALSKVPDLSERLGTNIASIKKCDYVHSPCRENYPLMNSYGMCQHSTLNKTMAEFAQNGEDRDLYNGDESVASHNSMFEQLDAMVTRIVADDFLSGGSNNMINKSASSLFPDYSLIPNASSMHNNAHTEDSFVVNDYQPLSLNTDYQAADLSTFEPTTLLALASLTSTALPHSPQHQNSSLYSSSVFDPGYNSRCDKSCDSGYASHLSSQEPLQTDTVIGEGLPNQQQLANYVNLLNELSIQSKTRNQLSLNNDLETPPIDAFLQVNDYQNTSNFPSTSVSLIAPNMNFSKNRGVKRGTPVHPSSSCYQSYSESYTREWVEDYHGVNNNAEKLILSPATSDMFNYLQASEIVQLYKLAESPFITMRPNGPSGELNLRLDDCCEQFKSLEKERKKTEAELARHNPGKKVSSANNFPVPRLVANPSRVDKLIVDQLREHSRVITLVAKMEQLHGEAMPQGIGQTMQVWHQAIKEVQTRRKEECLSAMNRACPTLYQDKALLDSISTLTVVSRQVRSDLWCSLTITLCTEKILQ